MLEKTKIVLDIISKDEGINTLVKDHKSYEWYRKSIEGMIQDVMIEELYKD